VTVFGALNVQTGDILHQMTDSCKQEAFLSFLQQVVQHYEEKLVIMVVDNAKIHRSKLVQAFLVKQERILLIHLPPYSPNLNPIERLWNWMKKTVIANRFHPTRASIEESIQAFLEEISKYPNEVLHRLGISEVSC
jgi:transposase